jgi:hypothetical protein
MKKLMLIVMSTVFLFASCKKDNSEGQASQKAQQVKFNVSVFDQSIGDFPKAMANANSSHGKLMAADAGASSTKLSNYIQRLEYFLYNAQGVQIATKILQPDSSETGFTPPSANLPAGTYTVIFVGSAFREATSDYLFIDGTTLQDFTISNTLRSEVSDVFFVKKQFEVASTDNTVDVTLQRPGGKMKLVIEDTWPANVDHVGLSINGYTIYFVDRFVGQTTKNDITIRKNSGPNGTNAGCNWENFMFTDDTGVITLNAVLTAYSKTNEVIVTKNVNNIRVEKNKITTVSGKLFDNLGQSASTMFNIKINGDWAGELHQSF